MLTNYWKFQNQNVQTFGFVYHDTNGQNHRPVWKIQSFFLERNLYGHTLAGLLWERQFEKILLKYCWEKVPNWECLSVHREKGLFLFVYVDDKKMAGKKQNINPVWKVQNKEVGNTILIRCGKYFIKKSIWESQHHSSIMHTWCVLRDNVK